MKLMLFILCCAAMAYGLFRPQAPPDLFQQSDKAWHLIAFAGLALSARLAFERAPAWRVWGPLYIQAALLEYAQHALQSSRQFSWEDGLANIIGVTLAMMFHGLWRHFRVRQ